MYYTYNYKEGPLVTDIQGEAERERLNQRGWEQERAWAAVKNQIPDAADGEVCRKKILEGLEKGNEEIVVFHAGAGYGKTTVMAQWARSQRARCCWYRINESDNDEFRFLRGLAASLSNTAPCFDAVLRDFFDTGVFFQILPENFYGVSEDFFMRCLSAFPREGICLCLDNYEVIKNRRVEEFLLRFAEYGAGAVKIFFMARGGFPEFLAANMMQGKVREISAEELCFEESETEAFLKHMTGECQSRHIVKNIQEYTGGWPAGVAFAGCALKSGRIQQWKSALVSQTHLYQYIFYEIFRKLSFDIQQFLIDISAYEIIEADVCNYALRRTDAEEILEYLAGEQIFISRLAAEQRSYRCEQIFEDYLKSRLLKSRREELLRLAAEYRTHQSGREEASDKRRNTGLSVKCLDNFIVNGKNGELTWRTKKTKELFACLFYEDGKWVARDILMERLWPEKPLKKAMVLFHTTVSYLRMALKENEAVAMLLVKNQFYAIDIKNITSDMELLRKWDERLKHGKITDRENPEELLELRYKGYMYGEDYVWADVYREQTERRYLWILKTLAKREKKQGNFVQAAAYLGKAVEINGYEISIREILVENLLLSGDITGAKREYERLTYICREITGETKKEDFEGYIKKFSDTQNFINYNS